MCTSIHKQKNVGNLLYSLDDNAIIFTDNKNKIDEYIREADKSQPLNASINLIEDSVSNISADVKKKYSLQPVEDENELLKKENRRLEEIENTLRGQYDSRKEISAAGLEAGAREIYRQVKSSVSVEEITNRLKKIQDDAREKDYSFEDFKAA